MGFRLRGWWDLLRRYASIVAAAWRDRRNLDGKAYTVDEAEFLPSSLSLQKTPVSPVPRVLMGLLTALLLIALAWSIVGRIDIVATAQGKIIPSQGTQLIQSVGTAKVKAIHVREGQSVAAGDLLIELDRTVPEADKKRLLNEWQTWQLQAKHAEAMLTALASGVTPRLSERSALQLQAYTDTQHLLEAEYAALQAELSGLDADLARRQAERGSTLAVLDRLRRTLPIVRQRAESLKGLAGEQYVARNTYLERERELIEQESELAVQQGRIDEIDALFRQTEQQKAALLADTRRTHLDRLTEARERLVALEQELIKVRQSEQLTRLTAPVSGTVQQLAVHTIGGVVTEAQTLMLVVPEEHILEVEAFLENKDIGFVLPEQHAEVKIETFPYTKYGIVPATVLSVSDDAISDEKRGLIYSMRLALKRPTVKVNGHDVGLSPGMAVTAEIKTGRRRLIEYFLGPLVAYSSESLRER